jgi:Domain of unknown function (DUF4190)
MTEPSDSRVDSEGTPPTAPPYPYQQHFRPGPYPGGYPPPPQPTTPRNGLGTMSLVLAIIALLGVWSVVGGIILGLAAVVIGLLARGRVKRGRANNGGVAIAGIVLGALAVIVGIAFIPIWATLWSASDASDYANCLHDAGPDRTKQQHCSDQFREHLEKRLNLTHAPSPAP